MQVAPISGRLRSKVCMAMLKPLPSAPRSASFGIRTSSDTTSVVSAARWPSWSFMRCFLMPGRSAGNTNAEMPGWRAFGSRVARTMYHCATLPFEMKCLVPSEGLLLVAPGRDRNDLLGGEAVRRLLRLLLLGGDLELASCRFC